MKRIGLLLIVGLISLVIGFQSTKMGESRTPSEAERASGLVGSWVSQALSVKELYNEADLVVRVRVLEQHPRVLAYQQPAYELAEVPYNSPKNESPYVLREAGEIKMSFAYTDSTAEVLTVYKGASEEFITIMQMGSSSASSEGYQTSYGSLMDDPLYAIHDELILFLVDISGDEVHAPSRTLYRIVNPAGRYSVQGERVSTSADPEKLSFRRILAPSTLQELEDQLSRLKGEE